MKSAMKPSPKSVIMPALERMKPKPSDLDIMEQRLSAMAQMNFANSKAVSREGKRAATDRINAELSRRGF